ncbi:MAG: SpoIVB peptidase [Clostridia bacterium]|nr:SpoIVB peptidase [Clostridia bacterium]
MQKNVKKLSFIFIFILTLTSFTLSTAADSETVYVIPSGEAVGVKIYTQGLLVVGMSQKTCSNKIKVNDRIEYANGTALISNEQFADIVNKNPDKITVTVDRKGEKITFDLKTYKDEDGINRLGLWLRDSTAGIGTVTYFNPKNNTFAALGHGIADIDTGNILTVKSGNILPCHILSVTKGENGNPGELNGSFDGSSIGKIMLNTENGIFGKYSYSVSAEPIPVASVSEIKEGYATILANVDGGSVKEYTAEIIKINPSGKSAKNMIIKITDRSLLAITGGIVQGMSGAPIIQNGKLVGAVTHVFVNDSSKGYGVFAENMINVSENIDYS